MKQRNYGLDLQREIREQSDKDWKFGATSLPSLVSIPQNEREQYLQGEVQFSKFGDFKDCATRAPSNYYEGLFTFHYQHDMKPENKKWMEENDYIENGKVTFSDRFTAILSGTTREGNSLKAPLESIRKNGLIPDKLLPQEDWMKWEDYHDPSKITQTMRDLGQEFARRFTINYERVNEADFETILESDMVDVAGYAWNKPINGVYQRVPNQYNHAFLLFRLPKYQAWDSYWDFTDDGTQIKGDFTKNLAPNYDFWDYGYRLFISAETVPSQRDIQRTVFEILAQFNLLSYFAIWWDDFFNKKTPIPSPIAPITPKKPPVESVKPESDKEVVLPIKEVPSAKLAEEAKLWLGKDASPQNLAPQELSCAESIVNIVNSCWPDTLNKNIVSTAVLFQELQKSPRFKGVLDPVPGCIEISPRTVTVNGHAGIYVSPDSIASNDSRTGLFNENYTRASWRKAFIQGRGLKAYLFMPV